MGKKLTYEEKYNKVDELKILLTQYFNENNKLDGRGIDKCDYLPTANYIVKLFRDTYKNEKITLKDIYNILNIHIPIEYKCYFDRNEYTYDELYQIFKINNCELLSTTFDNLNSKVNYKCNCGNISTITICEFLQGHRCIECGKIKCANKRKKSFDIVKETYIKNNCILLSTEDDYKNNSSQLTFICSCGNIYTSSFKSYSKTGNCLQCGINKCNKENHYCWKGGISHLHEYLRNKINDWKYKSAKYYNYKCVLTGMNYNNIHHLYSYHKILEECLNNLNYVKKENISDYSNEELEILTDSFLRLHYNYGLGVPLNEQIHKLFHENYGNDNTPEQFEEFKTRLKLGEFDDFLKENNLKIII